MCGLNLVTIIGWKINKVTNHELTFTKRSSNRVKCSRTTTKGEIARVLMCWARLLWSTPTISATMCRWALFGWNNIILDENCTGHQQSSEVYGSFYINDQLEQCTMCLSPLKSCIKEFRLNAPLCAHFPSVQFFQTKYLAFNIWSVSLSSYIWGRNDSVIRQDRQRH